MLRLRAIDINRGRGGLERLDFAAVHYETTGDLDLRGGFDFSIASAVLSIINPQFRVQEWQVFITGDSSLKGYMELGVDGVTLVYLEMGGRYDSQRLELEGTAPTAHVVELLKDMGVEEFQDGMLTLIDQDDRLQRIGMGELEEAYRKSRAKLEEVIRHKRERQDLTERLLGGAVVPLPALVTPAGEEDASVAGLRATVDGLDNFPEAGHA